jgi:hypothetical protein
LRRTAEDVFVFSDEFVELGQLANFLGAGLRAEAPVAGELGDCRQVLVFLVH